MLHTEITPKYIENEKNVVKQQKKKKNELGIQGANHFVVVEIEICWTP